MPRTARKQSASGIYHIILRGINRFNFLRDDEDRKILLQTFARYKKQCGYSIIAYCLMDNHLHMLIRVGAEPLEQIMRRVCGSYVYWYNMKYDRIGNLFQDRFKSEPVDSDEYFLTVTRYIHQNPVKAGIVKDVAEYRWSSYREYLEDKGISDRQFLLKLFCDDKVKALNSFIEFTLEQNEDQCLEIEETKRLKDDELRDIINAKFGIDAAAIQNEPRRRMEELLKMTLKIEGVSTRQLSRVTGISPNTIWRL